MSGGQIAIRGFLVQTLIALLEALEDSSWSCVTLEPNVESEKVDILWQYNDNTKKAAQVKSTENTFDKADIERWATELQAWQKADKYELTLVGTPASRAVASMRYVGKVEIPPIKNLDLHAFTEQAAHKLDGFLKSQRLPVVDGEQRVFLAEALSGHLTKLSTKGVPLTRAGLIDQIARWIPRMSTNASGTLHGLSVGIEVTHDHLVAQIRSGNADTVTRLMQAGMSPNIDLDGKTPLRLALELVEKTSTATTAEHRNAVVSSLVNAGDPPRDLAHEGHDALNNGQLARLRALLEAGMSLDLRDESGATLLAKAMRRDDATFDARSESWRAADKVTEVLLRNGNNAAPHLLGWALRWACRKGHLDIVKEIASRVPLTEAVNGLPQEAITNQEVQLWKPGVTPLHLAAECRSTVALRIVAWLLKNGADPQKRDGVGNTPLMTAIEGKQLEVARQLAAFQQQDLSVVNKSGKSALTLAVQDPDLLRLLLDSAAGKPDATLCSPQHEAAYCYAVESLKLALASRGNVDIVDEQGLTPLLQLCCFWNQVTLPIKLPARQECFEILLNRGANVEATDPRGMTPLHWLVGGKDAVAVRTLLERKPDVNAIDHDGRTPLMSCLHPEMIELLLQHGAQLEIRDSRGFSALAWATMFGREDIAHALRKAGADDRDLGGAEVIHASLTGNPSKLQELLRAGADPNTRDGWGSTALHGAASHGHVDVVRLLLEHGAQVDNRDEIGATAMATVLRTFPFQTDANAESFKASTELMLNSGATLDSVDKHGNSAAHVGFWWWHFPDIARRLLDACFERTNHEGTTLLMTAVQRGTYENVRYLLEQKKVDVNALDRRGRNALFHLSGDLVNSLNKGQLLLDRGADIERTDEDGRTPLLAAAATGHTDLVRLFIEFGADLHHRDRVGRTARHHAIQIPNVQIVNFLLECEQKQDRQPRRSNR